MTAKNSKWSEIRNTYVEDDITYIDGFLTEDDDEQGKIIAEVNNLTGKVKYNDEQAKSDSYAVESIAEVLNGLPAFPNKQDLVNAVILSLRKDFVRGDYTVLDELLNYIHCDNLVQALPEENWLKYQNLTVNIDFN